MYVLGLQGLRVTPSNPHPVAEIPRCLVSMHLPRISEPDGRKAGCLGRSFPAPVPAQASVVSFFASALPPPPASPSSFLPLERIFDGFSAEPR